MGEYEAAMQAVQAAMLDNYWPQTVTRNNEEGNLKFPNAPQTRVGI